jgi:hypothetical protein
MNKDSFLELLQRNSPREILEFIDKNSKPPKPVNAIYFFDDNGKRITRN